MTLFIESRISPTDVSPSQRLEYLAYLDKTITFLTEAKVDPIPYPVK